MLKSFSLCLSDIFKNVTTCLIYLIIDEISVYWNLSLLGWDQVCFPTFIKEFYKYGVTVNNQVMYRHEKIWIRYSFYNITDIELLKKWLCGTDLNLQLNTERIDMDKILTRLHFFHAITKPNNLLLFHTKQIIGHVQTLNIQCISRTFMSRDVLIKRKNRYTYEYNYFFKTI